jgi:hypothetical protein
MYRAVQSRPSIRAKVNRTALYCLLILLLNSATRAQVSVVNPEHLEVSAERARVLLNSACSVVSDEFRRSNASELRFETVLMLGSGEEHYTVDEKKNTYTVFLNRWDERKFATLAMRFCVQRLAASRENHLVEEIFRRANRIGPVSVDNLKGQAKPVLIPPVEAACYSAARTERCPVNQPPH